MAIMERSKTAETQRIFIGRAHLNCHPREIVLRVLEAHITTSFTQLYLGGDVKPEQLKELEQHQHQFRRPSRPMNTPINTAAAIVPRGLRRAIPSSSVVTVFACSLAADVISAPLSA